MYLIILSAIMLFLSTNLLAQTTGVECGIRNIQIACEQLSNKSNEQNFNLTEGRSLKNPRYKPSQSNRANIPLRVSDLLAQSPRQPGVPPEITNREDLAYQRAREIVLPQKKLMEEKFLEAKNIILSTILKGRKRESLSLEEKQIIDRIETLTLSHGDLREVATLSNCQNNSTEAKYSRRSHSIILCPGVYQEPLAEIMNVLGHEIAHSFDPCMSSRQIEIKITQKRIYNLSPINRDRYPYRDLERCLETKSEIRNIPGHVCGTDEAASQMNEAFADVFGAIVLDTHLYNNPPVTDYDRFAAMTGLLGQACSELNRASSNSQTNPYANSVVRIERFILQSRSLANSLRCRRNEKYNCFGKIMDDARLAYAARANTQNIDLPTTTRGNR